MSYKPGVEQGLPECGWRNSLLQERGPGEFQQRKWAGEAARVLVKGTGRGGHVVLHSNPGSAHPQPPLQPLHTVGTQSVEVRMSSRWERQRRAFQLKA